MRYGQRYWTDTIVIAAIASVAIFLYSGLTNPPPSSRIRIQDLTAIEEKGLAADKLATIFQPNAGTYPNAITSGYNPRYTAGSYPSQVTSGNQPNLLTRGTSPSRYISGGRRLSQASTDFPMPKLNF